MSVLIHVSSRFEICKFVKSYSEQKSSGIKFMVVKFKFITLLSLCWFLPGWGANLQVEIENCIIKETGPCVLV